MQYLKFWLKVISLLLLWGFLLPRLVHAQAGLPDPAFGGGDGYTTTSFFQNGYGGAGAVALQPNGRIIIAGGGHNTGENQKIMLGRYMPNGTLDNTFGNGTGMSIIALANLNISLSAIVILPNGKIMGTGEAYSSDGAQGFCVLARFNADGTADNTFDGDGILLTDLGNFDEYTRAMAVQTDGKIITAGHANTNGYEDFVVMRYHSNGTLDNSFGDGDGIVISAVGESYSRAVDVLVQPDGKILAAGFATSNGFEDFAVARYNSDGSLDPSFGGGDGLVTLSFTNKHDNVYGVALQPDGKIVLAGQSGWLSGGGSLTDAEVAVARLNPNGTPDVSFGGGDGMATLNPGIYVDEATCLVLQPDGKILMGGYVQQYINNGYFYHSAVFRLTPSGFPDPTFGGGDGISILPISSDGDFAYGLALQPDGKVLAVGTARVGNYDQSFIARFLTGLSVGTHMPDVFSGQVSLYPNPVSDQATLEYELKTSEKIILNLYDLQGRFIQNLLPATVKTPGKHKETLLFASDIPSGNYLLVIESESGITTIEVIF